MNHRATCCAALSIAAAAFLLTTPGPGADQLELWRHRNLGKAFFETPTTVAQAPAELKKALDLAPDSVRDRLNYGLALLRAGDVEQSIPGLVAVQKRDPSLPHTWFNLGIAYKRQRMYAEAIRQFEGMVTRVPDEPVTHYNLGVLYKLTGRADQALEEFETASRLGPRLVAPRYQIYTYYRLAENEPAMARALKAYQEAKAAMEAAGDAEDMEWCFYAELYDPAQAHPPGRDTSPAPAYAFEDKKLPGAATGLAVIDADGDHKPDLLTWSAAGIRVFRSGAESAASVEREGVTAVVPGDFDNDGLPDLCVLTRDGAELYRNRGRRFEPAPVKLPPGRYKAALWVDFDHDYDLDLFLLGDESVLMRNEGEAGFRNYTAQFPFEKGAALDAVAFRATPDSNAVSIAVTYSDHDAVLYEDQLRGAYRPRPLGAALRGITGLRAFDLDNDSWIDLAYPGGVGVNGKGAFTWTATRAKGPFAIADLENRGLADLIADGVHRNLGLVEFGERGDGPAWYGPRVAADFDNDGRIDFAYIDKDGAAHVAYNKTATKNHWSGITLEGVKNIKSAEGAEVEIKAGDRYAKQAYQGVPLVFGLGPATSIDTVRINWANGMVQNVTNQQADRYITVKEAPRMSGSCPMIFTWNGRRFEFITDVLGVAPLGASSGDGRVFAVDHDEYVQIPGESLVAKDGVYDVRITEELREVSYLDKVSLIAVDHPASTEVFTNDKFKSPPFPNFRLFGVSKRIAPVSARDEHGRDVLGALLRRDRRYSDGSVTLDFGRDAAPVIRAVLILNGWVDWADGSMFMAASQGGGPGLQTPSLQVKDANGIWRTVIEDMGMPAGKPKTIAVDLTGKFLSASREVRILTNMSLHWDEAFLSEQTETPAVRLTSLNATTADLRLRGFSRATIDPRREQPESFDYNVVNAAAPWNATAGLYTRYGDVKALMAEVDDRMVIMGSGDEVRLSFSAASLPPVPNGWKRDFLLYVDGWAKDADANTAYSQTVEPLPFHGMTGYPYGPNERFPDRGTYQRDYNTRPAVRMLRPLVAGR